MEKIRNAKIEDIESLKVLWIECFPNDIEYSKFFFEKIFRLSSARVCEVNGAVVGMLHSFPRTVCANGEKLSAEDITVSCTADEGLQVDFWKTKRRM